MAGRGLPLYKRAADDILSLYASGRLGAEFTVPEAAQAAGMKVWAVRKAAEHLAERGLIESHHGSGYRALLTREEAAAARVDDRPLREQVAGLQREVASLRDEVGRLGKRRSRDEAMAAVTRIEVALMDLYGKLGFDYPRDDSTADEPGEARHENSA